MHVATKGAWQRCGQRTVLGVLLFAPSDYVEAGGNPCCFEAHHFGHETAADVGDRGFKYEHCCDTNFGPKGDMLCWDALLDYDFCCRDPKPLPHGGNEQCWAGELKFKHELCCEGGWKRSAGPRGMPECWQRAAEKREPHPDSKLCCSYVPAYGSGSTGESRGEGKLGYLAVWLSRRLGEPSRPSCLREGYATSCSFPERTAFRQADLYDLLVSQGQGHKLPPRYRPPLLWQLPMPRATAKRPRMEFLTLGVGTYVDSVAKLANEAQALGVFDAIHTYTDFTFLSELEEQRWEKHIRAYRETGARIAGYGWWKPVLCRRHLRAPSLLPGKGMLVFSDSGSMLEMESKDSWHALSLAMRSYDMMVVVEPDFLERLWTKQHTLDYFSEVLKGTGAWEEGQFITGLFVLRKTPATERLLWAWEQLVEDIDLVSEEKSMSRLNPRDPGARGHRHEQSVWSLLLKCSMLNRLVPLRQKGPLDGHLWVNVTARILVISAGFESHQLMVFARRL